MKFSDLTLRRSRQITYVAGHHRSDGMQDAKSSMRLNVTRKRLGR